METPIGPDQEGTDDHMMSEGPHEQNNADLSTVLMMMMMMMMMMRMMKLMKIFGLIQRRWIMIIMIIQKPMNLDAIVTEYQRINFNFHFYFSDTLDRYTKIKNICAYAYHKKVCDNV